MIIMILKKNKNFLDLIIHIKENLYGEYIIRDFSKHDILEGILINLIYTRDYLLF